MVLWPKVPSLKGILTTQLWVCFCSFLCPVNRLASFDISVTDICYRYLLEGLILISVMRISDNHFCNSAMLSLWKFQWVKGVVLFNLLTGTLVVSLKMDIDYNLLVSATPTAQWVVSCEIQWHKYSSDGYGILNCANF